jgi:hypothetical protein
VLGRKVLKREENALFEQKIASTFGCGGNFLKVLLGKFLFEEYEARVEKIM